MEDSPHTTYFNTEEEMLLDQRITRVFDLMDRRAEQLNKRLGIKGILKRERLLDDNERLNQDVDSVLEYVGEEIRQYKAEFEGRNSFYSSKDKIYAALYEEVKKLRIRNEELHKIS